MLKLVNYTSIAEQSVKTVIWHPALPAHSSSNIPTPSTDCMCFAKVLLLIDYKAVPPVPS